MSTRKYLLALLLVIAMFFAFGQARAQGRKNPYPRMAPVNRYLMARNAEITLARSAAPESVSRDAGVIVFTRHGYETAVKGKNGFVCDVERSWRGPIKGTQFWNPKIRGAVCYNPPAVRSILPVTYMMAKMALAGLSKAQMKERMRVARAKKELPALEPGAMCYMMSKRSYLNDAGTHNLAHLMFYEPEGVNWGANLPGSPVYLFNKLVGTEKPVVVFIIAMGRWSDGTPAPRK